MRRLWPGHGEGPPIAVAVPVRTGQIPHPHAAASRPDQPPQNFTVHRYPP